MDAVVVLPDHIHAVWTLPPGDADFSVRWRLIKSHFVRALPKHEPLSDVRGAGNERGIWQRRFWEYLIRDEADYARHVEYCYINPVKHGLVTKVRTGHILRFIGICAQELSRQIGQARLMRSASSASDERGKKLGGSPKA